MAWRGRPAFSPGQGKATKCGQRCRQTHRMAAMAQTLLDEAPLLPRLLLCELYLLEQSIQVHFCLLAESVGSLGLAVFVEGWLIEAGMPQRKVRLGPATALPSGLCATEAWTTEGSNSGRQDTAEEEEVAEGCREWWGESEPQAEGSMDDWLGEPTWETWEMELSRQRSSRVGAGERRSLATQKAADALNLLKCAHL